MSFIGNLLILVINIYIGILIIAVLLYWLIAFDVLNTKSPQAQNLVSTLDRITRPPLNFLGRYIPTIGGIDITPIVLILGLELAKTGIATLFFG